MVEAQLTRLRHALGPLDGPSRDTLEGLANARLMRDALGIADFREAAVLLGLVPRASGLNVLLTLRAEALRHHAGQVSFPGGRMDAEDDSLLIAALRELHEETGIGAEWVDPIGLLPPMPTISGFRVTPVVAVVQPDYVALPNPAEVAEVFEVGLDWLRDPAHLAFREVRLGDTPRRVPEYIVHADHAPHRIWGATAMMLQSLIRTLE